MSVLHGSGLAGRGTPDIVDGQLHLAPALGIQGALDAMDALGIRCAMLDELWGRNDLDHGLPCIEFEGGAYRPLSPLAQAAALQFPDRFAYLQRITRRDPGLPQWIAQMAASPGCRALRVVVLDPLERASLAGGGYDGVFELAQAHGLPLCVLAGDAGSLLARAAPRFPTLQFIIDHCGWVKTPSQWEDVLALARLPNTWLKWSHAARAFRNFDEPHAALPREFLRAVSAYGADRVLWAADVTHEESKASWHELLAFVTHHPALTVDERRWLLGGTARRVFRWPAT